MDVFIFKMNFKGIVCISLMKKISINWKMYEVYIKCSWQFCDFFFFFKVALEKETVKSHKKMPVVVASVLLS